MTYLEAYRKAKTEEELKLLMKKDAESVVFFGLDKERLKIIENVGNKVLVEKGW